MRFYLLAVSILMIAACQAGKHSVLNSSERAITVAYPGYKLQPTVTKKAKAIADKHCGKYFKKASYSGATLPNPLTTMEWHKFRCVEKQITASLDSDVREAMTSDTAIEKLSTYLNCIRNSVVFLDDFSSDAATIATAIASVCSEFHHIYTDEILSRIKYSKRIESIVQTAIVESASGKLIPYVLTWRRIVRSGFSPTEKPSKKELPNNLYTANVKIEI